ncbi:MAG: DUF4089 domain-containing protein [Alphaproteobacteria bacterium]|nr:DUF4089 domain-containing protein [Alphaproteobacteria bacterium]
MSQDNPDYAALTDAAAALVDLPIAPEYRAKVIENVARSHAIARPLLALDLDDGLETGPTFRSEGP